jgi:hypothetical protein
MEKGILRRVSKTFPELVTNFKEENEKVIIV